MKWTCPNCNISFDFKKTIYPVRCRCGLISYSESEFVFPEQSVVETSDTKTIYNSNIKTVDYKRMNMPIKQSEFKKVDELIRELEKEGIQKQHFDKPPEGLGDTVERVLMKFGITKELVKSITGLKTCGCDKRKQWLNKLFPYVKE
jgi:hypothetical protein